MRATIEAFNKQPQGVHAWSPRGRPITKVPLLILNQRAINHAIVSMLDHATTTFTWISMMSQHNSTPLVAAVHRALRRGVDVRIFHCTNPYVPLEHPYPYPMIVIPMHGRRLPPYLSSVIGSYVSDFRRNVTHARFVINDDTLIVGGVDYNVTMTMSSYVQHALMLRLTDPPSGFGVDGIHTVVAILRTHGDLQWCTLGRGGFIGTTPVDSSAVDRIIAMIMTATRSVFIENQYIEHQGVLAAVWRRQVELKGRLDVTIVGNLDFELNPYHPTQWTKVLGWIGRRRTVGGLRYLQGLGCTFSFRVYPGKYTHNKLFVVDEQQICWGTFNLNDRSLEPGWDIEIGVYLADGSEVIGQYVTRVISETVENVSFMR
jgi:hypothetical protein